MFRTSLVALLIVSIASFAVAQDAKERKLQFKVLSDTERDGTIELLIRDLIKLTDVESKAAAKNVTARLLAPGKYWVGLHCEEADPALLSQLKLPAGSGIVVRKVFDKTAAAKAGIEVHDLLLKAGDVKLSAGANLIKAVQQAETKPLTFAVVRKGKTLKIEVAPSERRKYIPVEFGPNGLDTQKRRIGPRLQGRTLQFRRIGPGIVMGRNSQGLRIGVTKYGDGLTKITVDKDGKNWTVTDKTLDKLPEDIRKTVREHLKRIESVKPRKGAQEAIHLDLRTVPSGNVAHDRPLKWMHAIQLPRPGADDNTGKRLESVEKKLDQLQKSINALVNQKK